MAHSTARQNDFPARRMSIDFVIVIVIEIHETSSSVHDHTSLSPTRYLVVGCLLCQAHKSNWQFDAIQLGTGLEQPTGNVYVKLSLC